MSYSLLRTRKCLTTGHVARPWPVCPSCTPGLSRRWTRPASQHSSNITHPGGGFRSVRLEANGSIFPLKGQCLVRVHLEVRGTTSQPSLTLPLWLPGVRYSYQLDRKVQELVTVSGWNIYKQNSPSVWSDKNFNGISDLQSLSNVRLPKSLPGPKLKLPQTILANATETVSQNFKPMSAPWWMPELTPRWDRAQTRNRHLPTTTREGVHWVFQSRERDKMVVRMDGLTGDFLQESFPACATPDTWCSFRWKCIFTPGTRHSYHNATSTEQKA